MTYLTLPMALLAAGTALIGFVVGMWLKNQQNRTSKRVQQELWDRKFRLAESDRQEAVDAFNRNNVETKRMKSKFDGLTDEITRLKEGLNATAKKNEVLENAVATREETVSSFASEAEGLRQKLGEVEAELESRSGAFEELAAESSRLREDLAAGVSHAAALEERLPEIERLRAEVKQRGERIQHTNELLDEKEHTIEGMEERLRALDPLPEQLQAAEARVAELESEGESSRSASQVRIGDLEARVSELSPLPQELATAKNLLAEREERHARESEQRIQLITRLQERLAELESFPERVDDLEREIAKNEETYAAAAEESAHEVKELEARVLELEPLQDQVGRLEAELAKQQSLFSSTESAKAGEIARLEGKLEALEGERAEIARTRDAALTNIEEKAQSITALDAEITRLKDVQSKAGDEKTREIARLEELQAMLEERLATRDREVQNLQSNLSSLAPLTGQLAQRDKKLDQWEARFEKLSEKGEAEVLRLKTRASELDEKLRAAKKERAEEAAQAKTRLNAVSVEHKACQLKLSRSEQRVASLEAGLEGQKEKLDSLKQLEREQRIQIKAAQAEARRNAQEASAKSKAMAPGKAKKPAPAKTPVRKESKRAGTKLTVDDLKVINGIGPSFERGLNKVGISSYRQIARMDAKAISSLAAKINVPTERIKRDRWVQRAKQEHFKKYSERI